MKNSMTDAEFYVGLQHLPKPIYPFPDFIHPDFQKQREEYYQWIDTEYIIHSKEAREKHKKHHLTDIAARGCPFLETIDELRPLANYTANGAMMDDYFDRCTRREMYEITNRIISLLNGSESDEPAENGIFHLFWVLRQDALKCAIPEKLYNRFVKSIQDVLIGYSEEKVYYRSNTIPPLSVYLLIREATSGVQPYCDYVRMQKNYNQIPDEVFDHPHIRRIYTLCALMIGIHNDIISLPKEIHREGDTMNIVKVLQQEDQSTLHEAYMKAIELHDLYLNEFLILQKHLPPFEDYEEMVYNYVEDLGIMVSGVYAWHTNDTSRYVNGGYVQGEYASQ
ncbi:Terpene synthase family, metal binding domain [Chryseobacterium arachidis]|uniref:Terpene synthase n=1 Tax=Chryseobacterium arachidis TaxID=1416778 RepID=A0A1M4X6K4_9FLAO|nr:terpene synthase [Chryseobacterium arachidis]SHE88762.1 Terpene synthase family, metal binding domain [Chryseobacterium arachidis]